MIEPLIEAFTYVHGRYPSQIESGRLSVLAQKREIPDDIMPWVHANGGHPVAHALLSYVYHRL